jgi:hypothetical protein
MFSSHPIYLPSTSQMVDVFISLALFSCSVKGEITVAVLYFCFM